MAKRFTATEKWADPWFCALSSQAKLFWIYILDNCDHAGIWDPNWPLVKHHLNVNETDLAVEQIKERVQVLNSGKWFISKFIDFQYGELRKDNRAHNSVINRLEKEGAYKPLISSFQGAKDKDKDKEQDKDKEALSNKPATIKPDEIIEIWNRYADADLPRVEFLNDSRIRHIKARFKALPQKEDWVNLIELVNSSDFLSGRNGKFRATFDWVINPTNMTKILEGNYANQHPRRNGSN